MRGLGLVVLAAVMLAGAEAQAGEDRLPCHGMMPETESGALYPCRAMPVPAAGWGGDGFRFSWGKPEPGAGESAKKPVPEPLRRRGRGSSRPTATFKFP